MASAPRAAEALLAALVAGGGSQAQFTIPELGGMGQWSRGGMVMVGDMFNNALKARVDALCSELAGLVGAGGTFAARAPAAGRRCSLFVPGSGGGAVAGGARHPGLGRGAERHALRLLPGDAAAGDRRGAARSPSTTPPITGSAASRSSSRATARSASPASTGWSGSPISRSCRRRRRVGSAGRGAGRAAEPAPAAVAAPPRRRRRTTTSSARSSGWPTCTPAAS